MTHPNRALGVTTGADLTQGNPIDEVVIELLAQQAHELNRAYCEAIGDTSQRAWAQAAEWQRQSARDGVMPALQGRSPADLHKLWMDAKIADGWCYGPTKDELTKQHPSLKPYHHLPPEQRIKDAIYAAAVRTGYQMLFEVSRIFGLMEHDLDGPSPTGGDHIRDEAGD